MLSHRPVNVCVSEESPKKTENYPLEVTVRIFDCAAFCDIGEMTSDRGTFGGSKCQSKVVNDWPIGLGL